MAASWDTSLSCPVTALRHEEPGHDGTPGRCAGLAGAEGGLPWHIRTGVGRSWAGEAALTPRAPPQAPRLPNFAAGSGQLLPPCPRSAVLLSLSRSPWQRGSAPGCCCSGCSSDLEMPNLLFSQDPAGSVPPGLCSGLACPCAAQPGARGCSRGTVLSAARGMWGALPRPGVGSAAQSRASQMCNKQQPRVPATPGHSWVRDGDGEHPPCPLLPARLREKRRRTQPSFMSVIFLILFTSKMTKTKPSAPDPLPCLRWRAGEPRAPRPCVPPPCPVLGAGRGAGRAPRHRRQAALRPLPGEGTLHGSGECI